MADGTRFKNLKLQPYKQNSVALRRNLKLSSRFYGPYTVIQRIGQVAYKLDLPPGSKIHPVFHVSLLKKKLGAEIVPVTDLPEVASDGLFRIYPSDVLDRRFVQRGSDSVSQLLVRWGDKKLNLESWEDVKFLAKKFPNFDPWGQGSGKGGGIVAELAAMEVNEVIGRWDSEILSTKELLMAGLGVGEDEVEKGEVLKGLRIWG